jgi:hypothetical protein
MNRGNPTLSILLARRFEHPIGVLHMESAGLLNQQLIKENCHEKAKRFYPD